MSSSRRSNAAAGLSLSPSFVYQQPRGSTNDSGLTTPQFSPAPPDRRVRFQSSPEFYSQPLLTHSNSLTTSNTLTEMNDDVSDEVKPSQGVVLSIIALRGRLGCCYYDKLDGIIYFLQDQQDGKNGGDWDLVRLIVEQTQPVEVLTSTNADSTFQEKLEAVLSELPDPSAATSSTERDDESGTRATSEVESSTAHHRSTRLEYRPAREYYAGQGKNALAQLRIIEGGMYLDDSDSEAEEEDIDGRTSAYDFQKRKRVKRDRFGAGDRHRRNTELRLESFLNSLGDSSLTLGCAGALLGHIGRDRATEGELDAETSVTINGLRLMQLDSIMLLNSDAFVSLQIFNDESHALMHSTKTKEGLSLFGVMNLARTGAGRALLRSWFLRPPLDLDVIHNRHETISCFVRAENQHIADAVQSNLKVVKNAPQLLRSLMAGKGGNSEWHQIWQFINGSITIRDIVLNFTQRRDARIVEQFLAAFDSEHFAEIAGTINETIDWDESSAQRTHVIIRPGIDQELDELRRTYHGLPSLLSRIAQQISTRVDPSFVETLSVVYFPQLGYLLIVPFSEGVVDSDNYSQVGWSFQFVTEQYAYFKNDECYDLDRHIGDIHSRIVEKEIAIAQALLARLRDHESAILGTSRCLAELDCLLAFAECARLYEWVRPQMSDEPILDIRGGRHPLVELCVDSFVRNDCKLPEGSRRDQDANTDSKVIVITGANFSGKSVYLKQLALITYMAHLGSFVPAEQATIGLTDRILTRVSTRESIARGSSAFMIDCQQISYALRNATRRSLVLLDEFGKGTESDDGAGLFCATLQHLVERGSNTPRVAATTHFHSIFANGLLPPDLGIQYAHMTVLINDSSSISQSRHHDGARVRTKSTSTSSNRSGSADVTYLFKLTPGLSLDSHAAACASLFGIDDKTVQRAIEVTSFLQRFDVASIINADLSPSEKQDLKETESIARKFLQWDFDDDEWDDMDADEVKIRLRSLFES